MTTTTRLTLKQFLEIPEQKPGLEFDADGSIHQKMSPNWDHGALQSHLAYLLWAWLYADAERRRGYVQTEFRTNVAGASKLPDVAFYRRRPRQSKRKHALEIADVSIEILSPADDPDEQPATCEWYIENGGEVAVLLDPEQRTAMRFSGEGQVAELFEPDTLVLLPGLELPLREIFSVLDR
ncbi:MAG: Uma2 family endonuclease [Chloroflexi bacterium]|nr:Uma2 family endonuclease [Chloroflexota bacterium]